MVRPEILGLFAVECVNQDVIGDPILADEGTGQGFHQADSVVQSAICVNCDAQGPVGPHAGVFAIDFPWGKARHVDVPLARTRAGKNTRTDVICWRASHDV